jgi:hypothetical protein
MRCLFGGNGRPSLLSFCYSSRHKVEGLEQCQASRKWQHCESMMALSFRETKVVLDWFVCSSNYLNLETPKPKPKAQKLTNIRNKQGCQAQIAVE